MSPLLIVGAGPAGLTMALELARYGIAVRIIDRSPHATQTSKALVVWSRTLELMDRMGCGGPFLDTGLHAHGASIRSGTKSLAHVRFDDIASPYNFALMIPQRDTERLLTDELRARGVEIERQVELTGFTQAADHVEARLRRADGGEETVHTRWLIGCDGAHSTVRHGLGIDFHGSAQGDDWILADVRLSGDHTPPADEIATWLHRDGPFVVFPMPGGRARVISTVGKSDPGQTRPDPTLAEVQRLVDRRAGGGFEVDDPAWLANFSINERKVADYRRGNAFLVGDAAHIHSPAGGQGMNTGMQDAVNLAWKLALAMRGAGEALLETYSAERTAVGDMVLRNASRMTDMGTLSHPAAQEARNFAIHFMLGFHAIQERMTTQMSEVDIAYAKSPLSQGPNAGHRLAPSHYDGPPPGGGDEPRFVLYAADVGEADALARRFPKLLEAKPRRPADGETLLIVRPDGYVGFSGRAQAWAEAGAYLHRWQAV